VTGREDDDAVGRAFREEGPAILATLIGQVGDFGLAEDALQDAFAAAVATWGRDGVPARPGAWITTTARRKAIDRLRRERALADRVERLAALAARDTPADPFAEADADEHDLPPSPAIADDRLRLIFTCCHPALALEARVALTVKALGGLSTAEVARAFLVSEATMYQRLTRAKRKIAAAGIPYRVPPPELLGERLSGVLSVVYLVFNEGYAAASGDRLVRGELCGEAIRLGRLLVKLMPDDAEVLGLLALMLLQDARRDARVDPATGAFVALDAQDRTLYDQGRVAEGTRALDQALALRRPGPYQLQAAIAALHTTAADARQTDWVEIAALYAELDRHTPSPVIRVNRAAALAFAGAPEAGLELIRPLLEDRRLDDYAPLHAAHAELLRRTGATDAAAAAYDRAIATTDNAVERAELERRRALV
jgi:RNA polymerase sigma-70 factor (ECF subfamily)